MAEGMKMAEFATYDIICATMKGKDFANMVERIEAEGEIVEQKKIKRHGHRAFMRFVVKKNDCT
jgi:hypothetical protein